jgi:putative endonuclease
VARYLVYILRCSDGSLYTGITTDTSKRLDLHNNGRASKYTRARLPVSVAYFESANDKRHALRRKLEIKKLSRSEKLLLCSLFSGRKGHSFR